MAMSATEDQEKIQPEVSSSSGNEIEQSPLAKAAAQLLYKRLRVRSGCSLCVCARNFPNVFRINHCR